MGKLKIRRLEYACGAEISGLDLRKRLDDATVAEIQNAWLEHLVLCFPQQNLTPEEQAAFCGRFGELDDFQDSVQFRHPDNPTVLIFTNKPLVVKDKAITQVRADFWHSDHAFSPRVTRGGFLHAKVLPDVGGDTMFANQQMAYEALSAKMQSLVELLEGIQERNYGANSKSVVNEMLLQSRAQRVVQVIPETGRKTLYLGGFMRFFKGMTEEESMPLLNYLTQHATRHEFIYRHKWAAGDFLMWDNRAVMHYGLRNYDLSQMRQMQRCAVLGPEAGEPYEIQPAMAS
jgi:taurine dioxygenase